MAAKANILIDQGADFSSTVSVTDANGEKIDLSLYTASGQIRKHYTSETAVDITVTFNSPLSDGIATLSLTNQQTAAMEAGRYVYDVELVTKSSNVVTRMVEGIATVTPQVTRG